MDIAEVREKIQKLDALAKDPGATDGERAAAAAKSQELKSKYPRWETPTKPPTKLKAPPPTVHEWVRTSWGQWNLFREKTNALFKFDQRTKAARWKHVDRDAFENLYDKNVASQKRTEKFDPDRAFEWAWEKVSRACDADEIAAGRAFVDEHGAFIMASMLAPEKKARLRMEYERKKVDHRKSTRQDPDEGSIIATALRVLAA